MIPTWHTQYWYPQMLAKLIENPLLLPKQNDIVKDPLGKHRPLMINNSISPSQQKPYFELFSRIFSGWFPFPHTTRECKVL